MKTLLVFLASTVFCGTALAASPSSINNDDSCDLKPAYGDGFTVIGY